MDKTHDQPREDTDMAQQPAPQVEAQEPEEEELQEDELQDASGGAPSFINGNWIG